MRIVYFFYFVFCFWGGFRLQLVEIVGKKNRKVPVLLTKDMRDALDMLNSKRNAIGVPLENPFLFAAPSSKSGHLKCWDSLKWITNRVDLKNPDLITTTNMRKYIATVSQVHIMQICLKSGGV